MKSSAKIRPAVSKILLKLVRAVTELALWIAVSAIAALTVSWITDGFFGWGYLLGTLLLCFVLFLVATLLARHQRRITWKHLGITAALVAPVALYLGWDEPPSVTPLHVELLAPPPPRAAESHAVALWSPQGSHEPEPKRWTPVALGYIWHQLQPAEWRVFIMANRRVLLCECALGLHRYATANVWVRSLVGAPLWLFFNPNTTDNLAARCYRGLVDVAVEGRGEGFRAHEEAARQDLNSRAFKNVVGRWLVSEFIPKFDRIMVRSITVEDERRALLAEVQAKLAEAEKQETAPPSAAPKGPP
jgi:hypothetical protein